MATVKVLVNFKKSIIDVQGQEVEKIADVMGFKSIEAIRIGKYFEIDISDNTENKEKIISELSEKLLINPNLEEFTILEER
ncbi:phosphoribosylformylglycinamidine synthase subunit PurS [Companilactobacillus metriopterae]|uniref:phosphoribosylformylglycinamidine synthase subunit PurS n=1 Tax=Companilactobacillus metriopterae TaxID=1909267 RepID=UPI00100B8DB1|nr:phosphoribosylformylglycinamidine synthase subunit PurS [Companilactobacillus metriopterae]